MSSSTKHSDLDAVKAPSDERDGEQGARDGLPYARIQLSLFHPEVQAKHNDEEGNQALHKSLRGLVDDIEHVVWLNRHKFSFELLDFARWAGSQIGLFCFGIVLGVLVGIRIKEIIGCGVLQ